MTDTRVTAQHNHHQEEEQVPSVIISSALKVAKQARIIQFRGRAMVETTTKIPHQKEPFTQFTPLHKDVFEHLAYPILGGVSRSRMYDVFAYVCNTAPDLTYNEHLIAFGPTSDFIWDSKSLSFVNDVPLEDVVWRSPIAPSTDQSKDPNPFILSLAGGDESHYADIIQSISPIVSYQKPDGVIWWVGSGANGKSSLMDALYRIFPNLLSSLTVKRLTDGRDTPSLNGTLANIVKESSEGRIDDTQIYKSIGTHEDFRVHKFHSQDDMLIRGNMHHIFSANQIPVFNDKGYSARRRTFIVPFNQTFQSDPDFNDRTFTPENLSHIVSEILRFSIILKKQQFRYKFSQITDEAKADYDAEANNAEEYAKHIIQEGVVAFENFEPIKADYEQWCSQMGYVPLGVGNLRKAVQSVGFERITIRDDATSFSKHYRLPTVDSKDLQILSLGRPGLLTTTGFKPMPKPEPTQIDAAEGW